MVWTYVLDEKSNEIRIDFLSDVGSCMVISLG